MDRKEIYTKKWIIQKMINTNKRLCDKRIYRERKSFIRKGLYRVVKRDIYKKGHIQKENNIKKGKRIIKKKEKITRNRKRFIISWEQFVKKCNKNILLKQLILLDYLSGHVLQADVLLITL